jgi:hypothetical protein
MSEGSFQRGGVGSTMVVSGRMAKQPTNSPDAREDGFDRGNA